MKSATIGLLVALAVTPAHASNVTFGGKLEQGGLLVGAAPANAVITLDKRKIQISADGRFIAGFDRDAAPTAVPDKVCVYRPFQGAPGFATIGSLLRMGRNEPRRKDTERRPPG